MKSKKHLCITLTLIAWGLARADTLELKDGNILKIDTAVRPDTSSEDMITNLAAIGVAKR